MSDHLSATQSAAHEHPSSPRGRFVLVTGATSGIGLATAVLLALEGWQVIGTGRSEAKLALLEEAAKRADVTIRHVQGDVADDASVEHMKQEVLALTDGYGVDVLVNNAGYAEGGAIEDIPLDRLRKQFDTNVVGLVAMTQAFLPLMRQHGNGRIVNISSVVGRISIPLLGAYTASKHAVEAISDAMRVELAGSGIDVVLVEPGSIQTNFGATVADTVESWVTPASAYHATYEKFSRDRSLGRGGHPIVIAKTIAKALSARRPRPRYAAPIEAKAMPVLKAMMPTRALDAVLRIAIMGKPDRRPRG